VARAKSPASRPKPPSKDAAPAAPARFEGDETELVVMGRVVGPFGIRGWVRIKPFTEDPAGLDEYAQWIVRAPEGWIGMPLEEFELHAKGPVAKLQGCEDREDAERMRGRDIAVTREALGEAEEGTLYRVDLVGLQVKDQAGAVLGRVEGFFDTGDTGVMVVKGERERMIPFVPEYVKAVDRVSRSITVDWKTDYDA
jgi:16S rRNA processing protein RimM